MSQDPRSDALGALSQFLVTGEPLGKTLQRVAEITTEALPAARMAGISLLDAEGIPTTGVYTDPESPEIDATQYDSGRGPCLDAWRTMQVVRIDDMSEAASDYPEFADVARKHGVRSLLSLPLVAGGEGLGALNLYAGVDRGFSDADVALGVELASTASVVLANSSAYWGALELSEQLSEAMASRAVIEQAKGMLMASSPGIGPDEAFAILRQASQRENVKLRVVAQRIVDRKPFASGATD